jgi:hypothetical protein
MAIWSVLLPFHIHILWPFGIFSGHFGIFFPFWYVVPRKIWQPWLERHPDARTEAAVGVKKREPV